MKANCFMGKKRVEVQDVPDPRILTPRDAPCVSMRWKGKYVRRIVNAGQGAWNGATPRLRGTYRGAAPQKGRTEHAPSAVQATPSPRVLESKTPGHPSEERPRVSGSTGSHELTVLKAIRPRDGTSTESPGDRIGW